MINRDLKRIHELLRTGLYSELRYSGDGHGGLGSATFDIGAEVKSYIVDSLAMYHGKTIEEIKEKTEKQLRTREVKVFITITQLLAIYEKTNEFVVEFMLRMCWTARHDDEKWQPRLRWPNASSMNPTDQVAITPLVATAGVEVQSVQHYQGRFVQQFFINNFPVDTHQLCIYLICPAGSEDFDVKFVPMCGTEEYVKNGAGKIAQVLQQNVKWNPERLAHLEFPGETWMIHQINRADRLTRFQGAPDDRLEVEHSLLRRAFSCFLRPLVCRPPSDASEKDVVKWFRTQLEALDDGTEDFADLREIKGDDDAIFKWFEEQPREQVLVLLRVNHSCRLSSLQSASLLLIITSPASYSYTVTCSSRLQLTLLPHVLTTLFCSTSTSNLATPETSMAWPTPRSHMNHIAGIETFCTGENQAMCEPQIQSLDGEGLRTNVHHHVPLVLSLCTR